jgi:membrane associated rhomboid family serine protease
MAFLREPSGSREPVLRAPASVVGLIGVIVAMHLLRVLAPDWLASALLSHLALVPALYSDAWLAAHPGVAGSAIARAIPFVGYAFVHANTTHLVVNCLWLLAFGPPVARRLGALRFLAFFLVCGVAGAVAHVVANWASEDAAIGASGAIAGVMAASLRIVWLGDPFARREGAPLLPLTARQILTFTVLWVSLNVLTGVTGLGAMRGLELVAWQAHLGGYFAGLFLIALFDPRPPTDAPDLPAAA